MRVTILMRSFERGGAERQGLALAVALKSHGHQPAIVTFHSRGPFVTDARRHGVPVESIDRRNWRDAISFVPRVIRALRRTRPDIVCSYLGGPNVVATLAKPFLRRAKVVWGVRFAELDLRHEHPRARLVAGIEPRLSRFASGVITNSEAGARECARLGFPEPLVAVIPNGIDVDRFARDVDRGLEWRAALGIPHSALVVGRVGRVHPIKGIDDAIGAIALLRERSLHVTLVSLGDGSAEMVDELVTLARRSGVADDVHFHPATDDLVGAYSGFDALVSSSLSEGFPNVVAEAMACGTPCVVTDVGDSAVVVGEWGWVVAPHDPSALAGALEDLLRESDVDRARRTKAARHRIESEFSLDALATRTLEFLVSLTEER